MLPARLGNLPRIRGFGYLDIIENQISVYFRKNGKVKKQTIAIDEPTQEEKVKKELKKLLTKHNLIATGFTEHKYVNKITSSLWLENDTVTLKFKKPGNGEKLNISEHLKLVTSSFNKSNISNIKISESNEVEVTDLVSLADYRKTVSEKTFQDLLNIAKRFSGKSISFINSTPQGGGVAIMRHALMRLFKLLNINSHWYVLKPNLQAFNITKRKFHNILQAVAKDARLTQEDIKLYNHWIAENAKFFEEVFKNSDVIVIDDPQPSGLIPYIKKINPKAKVIYRSHIQIESKLVGKEGTPQQEVWEFLWNNIKEADCFVSHPVLDFVPKDVPREKLVFMPATTDPLDGLNKTLTRDQMDYYFHLFNKFLKEEGQTPVDLRIPYIIQIARFDPSKGIPDVLDSYYKLCKKLSANKRPLPQLIITGNGSIDDPDRLPVFSATMRIVNSQKFAKLRKLIKVVPIPHVDQLFNALLRNSKVTLQLSIKEGFEVKVTEALMKGIPVIAYKTGGIPLQVKDNINGFLIPVGKTNEVSDCLYKLLTDEKLYNKVSNAAEKYYNRDFLTIANGIRWLNLSLKILSKN